ncbi:hypothetical protein [Yeosuana sp.]|uniref:hypothetical protein n=1 Tax=Yeosuana sp. TaxID=2529388 RepID=UPI004049A29A
MNKLKITISLLLFTIVSFSQSSANDFKGDWFTSEMDNMTITIFLATDGFWYGKIIKSDEKENIGHLLLYKMKFDQEKNTLVGVLKRPDNGMKVNATVSLDGAKKLKVVGKKLLITKTVNWTKAD